MRELYKDFITKLEEQTASGELEWDTVFRVTHAYDIENFNYILINNEYHRVDELKSYGIANEKGLSIFLLNETFESGKDGSISDEKNLYVVKGVDGESYQIPVEEKCLLELEEKIKLYVESRYLEDTELNKLLDQYLKEH